MSLIHQMGLASSTADAPAVPSMLSRYAAPPRRKHAGSWTLLALASIGLTVVAYASARSGATIAGGVAVVATLCAARAAHYNARVYPGLQNLWIRSFMCARCGDIFAATSSR